MNFNCGSEKLYALPLQLIEINGGVLLKRGCTEVKIAGEGVAKAIRILLTATSTDGATVEEICNHFAPVHRPLIERIIETLVTRSLLVGHSKAESPVTSPESTLDIFHWHFDAETERVNERLNSRRIIILGVNCVSRQLAISLSTSGFNNFQVVDHAFLRNIRLFDERGKLKQDAWPDSLALPQECNDTLASDSFDCLVLTSDFGRSPAVREWNKVCVETGLHFLPVLLQNMIGYVGPMVVPGATACFECLQARQNSHLETRELHRTVEDVAFDGQRVIGFHPSMASIVAEIAAMELVKFYSGVLQQQVGTLLEVNLLATRLTARKVLKIPRCPVCSPLITRPPSTPKRSMFTLTDKASQ